MSLDHRVLVDQVRSRLLSSPGGDVAEHVLAGLRETGAVLDAGSRAELVRAVRADLVGAGPLQPLLDDPAVTDVLVNGPEDVWVDTGAGLRRTSVTMGLERDVRVLAVRLAATGGQRLDDACPAVDARLPDGTRLHAVLPPVSGAGTLIALRSMRVGSRTPGQLVAAGCLAPEMADVLEALVAARANVVVSGATGSGKTTLLAGLLSLVPPDERVLCIEEAGELRPEHPHVVRLLARRANVEGAGEVDLAALVRHALRMRPDRLVLGECRGAEVREVLLALNTGHAGGCTTLHANSAAHVPARLEAMGALAGMSRTALAVQAAGALDAVVHLRRVGPRRLVEEIAVLGLTPRRTPELVSRTALRWTGTGTVERGPGWADLRASLGPT